MQDRYRSRYRIPSATGRVRMQIALEARGGYFPRSFSMEESSLPTGSMPRVRTTSTSRNEKPRPSWVIASGPATSRRTTKSAIRWSRSGGIRKR